MPFTDKFVLLISIVVSLISPLITEAAMIKVNDTAPDFSLVANTGDTVRLSEYRGSRWVVLIFYPGDNTPVCTNQLCEIRDEYAAFGEHNCVVFGINPADRDAHASFAKRHGYQFPLLVDSGRAVAKAYGVNGILVKRTVVVIDMNGVVTWVKPGKPAVAEILRQIGTR
jgi:peroxiredoxin Q/BCP